MNGARRLTASWSTNSSKPIQHCPIKAGSQSASGLFHCQQSFASAGKVSSSQKDIDVMAALQDPALRAEAEKLNMTTDADVGRRVEVQREGALQPACGSNRACSQSH
jgi:hypothetical protein